MIADPKRVFDLATELRRARERTLSYVRDLSDEQLAVPMIDTINPLLWELGHVGYFAEYWTLRSLYGAPPILAEADRLYDSARIAHDTRWELPLPDRAQTLANLHEQLERSLAHLPVDPPAAAAYLYRLALHHEDMHAEAVLYTRQTLAYPFPPIEVLPAPACGPLPGDVEIPAGRYRIGARPSDAFVFDNEKWEHEVEIDGFRISRAPVTNAEYAAFVEAGGPVPRDWRNVEGRWETRHFAGWRALSPHHPVAHVSWNEAQAYCTWAGRRLPTEAEWEIAATGGTRRRYPWGDEPPSPGRANLDGWYGQTVDVAAFPEGESPFGVRGAIGNVWEWTATPFGPYPGFSPDAYREYSEPWFGDHYALRGGAWSTSATMISTRWRNFYRPQRCDVIAGFRTCD